MRRKAKALTGNNVAICYSLGVTVRTAAQEGRRFGFRARGASRGGQQILAVKITRSLRVTFPTLFVRLYWQGWVSPGCASHRHSLIPLGKSTDEISGEREKFGNGYRLPHRDLRYQAATRFPNAEMATLKRLVCEHNVALPYQGRNSVGLLKMQMTSDQCGFRIAGTNRA